MTYPTRIPYVYLTLTVFILYPTILQSWLVPQPIENTCVTLSKATGQDNFCLRTDSPKDPLQTCLIGLPWDIYQFRFYRPEGEIITRFTDLIPEFIKKFTALPSLPRNTFLRDIHLLMSTSPAICIYFRNEFFHPRARYPEIDISSLNTT